MAYDQYGNYVPDNWMAGPGGSTSGGYLPGQNPYTQAPAGGQYGYATAPGGGYGYYEQQTPAGSFAAANQQYGQTSLYGGQPNYQAQGVNGAPSVSGVAQQGQYSNPYLGGTAAQAGSAGTNPLAGTNNPYLNDQISASQAATTKAFNTQVMPQLDRRMQQSGSYGNANIGALQNDAIGDLGKTLGNIDSSMRFQDYTQQQQLGENALNRNQQVNLANQQSGQNDLSRNLAGGFQQAGMNNGSLLNAAMFDSTNNFGAQQFNAGAQNTGGMFNNTLNQAGGLANMGALNGMSQFNAQQGNGLNQFNTGQGNNMLNNYYSQQFQGGQNALNRQQGQGQFDANLDRGIYNDNMGWMSQGQQQQMNFLSQMMGYQNQGVNSAQQIQNMPLQYQQLFAQLANGFGGQGGGTSQNNQGNPWLSGAGGALTAAQLYQMLFGGQP